MDDLIGKVLAGEATAEELLQVEQWARENEANKKYYDHLKTIFEKAGSANVQIQFDTDAAWKRVRKQLGQHPRSRIKNRESRNKMLDIGQL